MRPSSIIGIEDGVEAFDFDAAIAFKSAKREDDQLKKDSKPKKDVSTVPGKGTDALKNLQTKVQMMYQMNEKPEKDSSNE